MKARDSNMASLCQLYVNSTKTAFKALRFSYLMRRRAYEEYAQNTPLFLFSAPNSIKVVKARLSASIHLTSSPCHNIHQILASPRFNNG